MNGVIGHRSSQSASWSSHSGQKFTLPCSDITGIFSPLQAQLRVDPVVKVAAGEKLRVLYL